MYLYLQLGWLLPLIVGHVFWDSLSSVAQAEYLLFAVAVGAAFVVLAGAAMVVSTVRRLRRPRRQVHA